MFSDFKQRLYQTILDNDYYSHLIRDFSNCRSHERNQVVLQFRDRGNKFDLVWDYFISPNQAQSFINKHMLETSFYKQWLYFRLNNGISYFYDSIQEYVKYLNSSDVVAIAQHNYKECYGICMMLFELLNKFYICNRNYSHNLPDSKPYNILRLATFYSLTFSKYHLEWDTLKSVDILSNFARFQDILQEVAITTILDTNNLINPVGTKFMYIWAMQKCFEIIPNYIPIKLHYNVCARMMHENQTVGGVTQDSLETPFGDCIKLGLVFGDTILQTYEEKIETLGYIVENDDVNSELEYLIATTIKLEIKNTSINYLQFLNKSIQIEDFDGKKIVKPPYRSVSKHFSYFLKEIGLSDSYINDLQFQEEATNSIYKYSVHVDNIIGKPIEYSFDTYGKLYRSGHEKTPHFRDMVLMLDEYKNLVAILLTGNNLYTIKKDIDWTGLFYGFPCTIMSYDFPNTLSGDRLHIALFGASETFDEVLFDKRIY